MKKNKHHNISLADLQSIGTDGGAIVHSLLEYSPLVSVSSLRIPISSHNEGKVFSVLFL